MSRTVPPLVLLLLCLPAAAALGDGFSVVGTAAFTWETFEPDARTESLAGTDFALAAGPSAHWFNAAPLPTGEVLQVG